MTVSDAPLLNCIEVAYDLEESVRNKKTLFNATHPIEANSTSQRPVRRYFNLKNILPKGLASDFGKKIVEDHEQLLVNNFVLLHARLNGFSPSASDLTPGVLPPRTA